MSWSSPVGSWSVRPRRESGDIERRSLRRRDRVSCAGATRSPGGLEPARRSSGASARVDGRGPPASARGARRAGSTRGLVDAGGAGRLVDRRAVAAEADRGSATELVRRLDQRWAARRGISAGRLHPVRARPASRPGDRRRRPPASGTSRAGRGPANRSGAEPGAETRRHAAYRGRDQPSWRRRAEPGRSSSSSGAGDRALLGWTPGGRQSCGEPLAIRADAARTGQSRRGGRQRRPRVVPRLVGRAPAGIASAPGSLRAGASSVPGRPCAAAPGREPS